MKIQFNSKKTLSTEEKVEKAVNGGKTVIRINWGVPKTAGGATYLTSNQGAFRVNTQDGSGVFLKFNPWTVQYLGVTKDDELIWIPNTPFVKDGEGEYLMVGDKVEGFMAYLLAFVSEAAFGGKLSQTQKQTLLQHVWDEVSLNLNVAIEDLVSLREEAAEQRGSGIYRSAVIAFELRWNPTSHRLSFLQGEVLSWEEEKFTLVQGNSVGLSSEAVMKAARDLTVKNPWGDSKVKAEDVFEGMSKNRRRKQERYGKYLEEKKGSQETPPVEKKKEKKKKREPLEEALDQGLGDHSIM